ncbi:hypothetical protein WDW89_01030 [Deltaproteobacteria bacterium TL4]
MKKTFGLKQSLFIALLVLLLAAGVGGCEDEKSTTKKVTKSNADASSDSSSTSASGLSGSDSENKTALEQLIADQNLPSFLDGIVAGLLDACSIDIIQFAASCGIDVNFEKDLIIPATNIPVHLKVVVVNETKADLNKLDNSSLPNAAKLTLDLELAITVQSPKFNDNKPATVSGVVQIAADVSGKAQEITINEGEVKLKIPGMPNITQEITKDGGIVIYKNGEEIKN